MRGMSSILSIATSGLVAASDRLAASARRVANPNTFSPKTDSLLRVDRVEISGQGSANLFKPQEPYLSAYNPTSVNADANGLVAGPEADLAEEVIAQIMARYAFSANAAVVRAYRDMYRTALDISV